MSHNKVYIALGANVGNWKNNFNQAVRLILKIGVITKLAPVYLSHPYGYERQHYFYNSALELETNLSPYDLFKELQMIEKKLQKNKLFVNGPRKIDLDIIFFNKLCKCEYNFFRKVNIGKILVNLSILLNLIFSLIRLDTKSDAFSFDFDNKLYSKIFSSKSFPS